MGLFGKHNGSADAPALPRERGRAAVNGDGSISIIAAGMHVVGDLTTDGTVRIEGRVEGSVRAGKAVLLGRSGEVFGDVITQDAVVGGHVQGTVVAESRLELQATAVIEGEIHTRSQHLQLDEGARFNGHIRMLEENETERLAIPASTTAFPEPA